MSEHDGTWAVSCSGGKDSTVMLSIAVEAGWRGPLFHFWYAETPPENTALVMRLGERFGLEVDTVRVPGAWDVFEECGRFFIQAETDAEKKAKNRMLAGYKSIAARFTQERGYAGLLIGMRRQESRARAMTLARKGAIYQTQDRPTWTCCPLHRWTGRDVWARHITHELPWLKRYDLADDREHERSEVTWLAHEGLWRHGQGQRMRETDPELWSRLVGRWPDLARWG